MTDSFVKIAGCVVEEYGKFLLVQEKKPSAYGLWNLPAGRVDAGETVELAAAREMKEESGYEVELVKKLGTYRTSTHELHIFQAKIVSGELEFPHDELLDAQWFSYDEIQAFGKEEKLRGAFVLESLNDYFAVAQ